MPSPTLLTSTPALRRFLPWSKWDEAVEFRQWVMQSLRWECGERWFKTREHLPRVLSPWGGGSRQPEADVISVRSAYREAAGGAW